MPKGVRDAYTAGIRAMLDWVPGIDYDWHKGVISADTLATFARAQVHRWVMDQVKRPGSIHCGDGIHFERNAGWRDPDRRYCERFVPRPQQTHRDGQGWQRPEQAVNLPNDFG